MRVPREYGTRHWVNGDPKMGRKVEAYGDLVTGIGFEGMWIWA